MNRIFQFSLAVVAVLNVTGIKAQSLTAIKDTVYCAVLDHTNQQFTAKLGTGGVAANYQWKVIDCNFPADWMAFIRSSICDASTCRALSSLWPSEKEFTRVVYSSFDTGFLQLVFDTGVATIPGCYYVTVGLYNVSVPTDSTTQTFSVCSIPASIPAINSANRLSVYPNPASDLLNIVFNRSSDGSIAVVRDFSGKEIIVQPVNNGIAAIQVGNIPKGIYFLQLVDERGLVTARTEFVKE